jgi:hypothetical protein
MPNGNLDGRFAVGSEPLGVVHAVEVHDDSLPQRLELLGQEAGDRLRVRPVGDREDLRVPHPQRKTRDKRSLVREGHCATARRRASSSAVSIARRRSSSIAASEYHAAWGVSTTFGAARSG